MYKGGCEVEESKEEAKRRKQEAKAQIKNLKQQQKDNKKEISRIKEENGQSNPSATLTILLVIGFLILLLVLIKLDVGGFASSVLGPAIGDVPYVNKILPASAQQEVVKKEPADSKGNKKEKKKDSQAETTTQATTDAATTEASVQNTAEDGTAEGTGDSQEQSAAATTQMDAAMQVYVDTYTNMEPASAAAILEGMAGDYDLVAQILTNMDAKARADILAAMSTNNAAKIMKIMESQ